MKTPKFLLLFIFIGIVQQGYSQTSFWVPLQKQQRDIPYTLFNNRIYEIEDISEFKVPEGIPNFVIGYLKLSEFHDRYNERYLSKAHLSKYKTLIKKYQVDTLQFAYNHLKYTKLYVLIYMQNGFKQLIIDTDFDKSFLNEEVHQCKFKKTENRSENEEYIFTELKLPMDSFQIPILKTIPVSILMNNTDYSEHKIGNNDSLQVYISENFDYQGFFMDGVDTIFLMMLPFNFDLLYDNRLNIFLVCEACRMPDRILSTLFSVRQGNCVRLKDKTYLFEEFDFINKRVKLTQIEDKKRRKK